MSRPNPVQEAVLARWGITLLSSEESDPQIALQKFLEALAEKVERLRAPATGRSEKRSHPSAAPRRPTRATRRSPLTGQSDQGDLPR
jgi:hypothetical protein